MSVTKDAKMEARCVSQAALRSETLPMDSMLKTSSGAAVIDYGTCKSRQKNHVGITPERQKSSFSTLMTTCGLPKV